MTITVMLGRTSAMLVHTRRTSSGLSFVQIATADRFTGVTHPPCKSSVDRARWTRNIQYGVCRQIYPLHADKFTGCSLPVVNNLVLSEVHLLSLHPLSRAVIDASDDRTLAGELVR